MTILNYLKREFFGWWKGFSEWVTAQDYCELCGNEQADYLCVGCDRRICMMCDSGYYGDANLCKNCRKDITPEEEAEDIKNTANDLKEQCTCPDACELSLVEHEYIRMHAGKEEING
jgi:hypothetical protein